MNDGVAVGDNPYAEFSGICIAARHAGALTSRGGTVTVQTVDGAPFFPAVKRNNIASTASNTPGRGFKVLLPGAAAAVPPPAPKDGPLLDASGRPIQQPIAATLRSVGKVQVYINFVTDSAELQPNAEPVLRELLATLNSDPGLRVDLIGHTDSTGTSPHNRDLSERRAATVYAWLVRNGIARDRLRSSGRGMAEPIADNGTPEGRALNRRVEVKALP
jgi:outer membrane protein OmpA-like peptidoglycan-associated protein